MGKISRAGIVMSGALPLTLLTGIALAQSPAQNAGTGASAPHNIQMVPAQAMLGTTLDAKKAKQGEEVTAKLQADVQVPNAQALPKNTVLEGHVDQVQPSENKGDSMLTVTFDKARLKDGQEVPIKATVVGISEPIMAQQADGQMAGGGLPPAGGAAAAPSPAATRTSSPNAPTEQDQTSMNGGAAQGGSAQQGHSTGVPGVVLKSDIHQPVSATFTSQGKNVKVPDGTQLSVAIAEIPAGVKLQ